MEGFFLTKTSMAQAITTLGFFIAGISETKNSSNKKAAPFGAASKSIDYRD
jgi:hypothetical protein